MKLLMTGSSGPKVGSVVAGELAAIHQLAGIDLAPAPHTSLLADITLVADWSPHLEGVDAVIHFAALHAPHRDTHSRDDFQRTNVEATARLLVAAKKAGVKRFLLASTTSVYGRAMRGTTSAAWVTEQLTPQPEDVYDDTKLAAEALCREAYSPGFVTAALRFSRSFPEPLPLMALYRLYRGVDARDVAQAFGLALSAKLDQFEAMNISGETPFRNSDCDALWVDPVAVLKEREPALVDEFRRRGWPLPSRIDRVYVIDKAKRLLGYAPRYGWRDALATPDGTA